MTSKEAVQALVAYVDTAPAYDELAGAARIVLQTLKAEAALTKRLAGILDQFLGLAPEDPEEEPSGELFAELPAQPVTGHPER